METKVCKDCGEEKSLSEYRILKGKNYNHKKKKYYHSYCIPCQTIRNRKTDKDYKKTEGFHKKYRHRLIRQYGIEPKEFYTMKEEQGGVCAICGSEANGRGELHIDHCHINGHVRGLLCHHCNTGLGHFKDDVSLLNAAALYLMRDQNAS